MSSGESWRLTSFYRFTPLSLEGLEEMRSTTEAWMQNNKVQGLVIFAPEGVNGTVAGSTEAIDAFKQHICDSVSVPDLAFKDASSEIPPFRRISVECRTEIVGLKRPDLVPCGDDDHHLSPREWNDFLASDRPHILIDTRNRYETRLGKFTGAIDPNLTTFSDWSAYLDKSDLPHDVPVLMYCTGGIRCEKALLEMRARGFDEVYQLRGGILGYLAECPAGRYEGDCYVFDDRVSVGPDLKPTGRFGICPGCGLTSSEKRTCEWCSKSYFVCEECDPTWPPVCSKLCKDRWQRHGPKPK